MRCSLLEHAKAAAELRKIFLVDNENDAGDECDGNTKDGSKIKCSRGAQFSCGRSSVLTLNSTTVDASDKRKKKKKNIKIK